MPGRAEGARAAARFAHFSLRGPTTGPPQISSGRSGGMRPTSWSHLCRGGACRIAPAAVARGHGL